MGGNGVEVVDGMGLDQTAAYIADVQRDDGLIPWYPDGPADPWDHVEAAMGLSVAGRQQAAERAYRWLADHQRDDGSWWAIYDDGRPGRVHRETHHAAYVATGVWHHYRVTGDRDFATDLWPTVERAVGFARSLQTDAGDVIWAVDADDNPWEDALVTGCCSVYQGLDSALSLARELGYARPEWETSRERLRRVIETGRPRFDRTWESKDRYAMDWFYPVLSGTVTGSAADARIADGIDRFLERGIGCRCVADEPWVTVAETAELVMAMSAVGRRDEAGRTFGWLAQFMDDGGAFWTGYQFDNGVIWPEERPTWTAGAVLLAADALTTTTDGATVFIRNGGGG